MAEAAAETGLLPAVQVELDQWLLRYPKERQQSGVLMALRLAQEANGGWLSDALIGAVADYLEMPKIAVYEVATFYSMYELSPRGRHKIAVCTNISCQLCGSGEIVKHLEKRLGIRMGETTADGQISLREVECLAACCGAPMLQINDRDYHEHLTPEKVDQLLAQLQADQGASS